MVANLQAPDDLSRGSLPPVGRPASPHLSEAGKSISEKIRAGIPLLRSKARESEELTWLETESMQLLHEAGVFKMTMPLEWGGLALGARDIVEVIATISEGDGSAGWMAFVGVGLRNALMLDERAVEEIAANAVDHVGPLIVGASVFATSVGDGRKVDGGWMVKGRWAFGSGCRFAPFALVGIEFDREHGSGRGVAVLTSDQYDVIDDWHVMGLCGTSSNGLKVEDETFVPDYRFLDLAELPPRLDGLRETFSGAAFSQSGPALLLVVTLSNVAITLGMARGALDCFLEQAPKRKPFNLPYPTVAEMPTVHVAIGRARAMINMAAAVIEGAADDVDARAIAGLSVGFGEESEITLGLAYASVLCEQAIELLQRTMGSSTAALSNPIQRFARDARVLNSHGALRIDPQAEITGRRLCGLQPFLTMGGALPDVTALPPSVAVPPPPPLPPR